MSDQSNPLRVEAAACIRCGSCVIAAPGLFTLGAATAAVLRQPGNRRALAAADRARALCPTSAIVGAAPAAGAGAEEDTPDQDDNGRLCERIALVAERARWRWDEILWSTIDRAAADAGLVALVRAIAFSELATFSASRRFLHEFADDSDFCEWIAVWLYEETRHPRALGEWTRGAALPFSEEEIDRGRVTAPFPKRRFLTLVTNVISEQVAAARYLSMSRRAPEAVLRAIGRGIAADEARHGAAFFVYARRHLARSATPDEDRRQALTLLHFWLQGDTQVAHPVRLVGEQTVADTALAAALAAMPIAQAPLERRLFAVMSQLIDRPLADRAALAAALRAPLRPRPERDQGA